MDINGTAAVVTGAASGLGEATARELARRGAKVAVFDRDAERASAADLIHLSEGEQWLRQLIENEDARAVLAGPSPEAEIPG